jgi:hypothetical protein
MTETFLFDSNARSTQSPERSGEQVAELEEVMQSDRDFFLQHPERDWYIRSVTSVELAEARSLSKGLCRKNDKVGRLNFL